MKDKKLLVIIEIVVIVLVSMFPFSRYIFGEESWIARAYSFVEGALGYWAIVLPLGTGGVLFITLNKEIKKYWEDIMDKNIAFPMISLKTTIGVSAIIYTKDCRFLLIEHKQKDGSVFYKQPGTRYRISEFRSNISFEEDDEKKVFRGPLVKIVGTIQKETEIKADELKLFSQFEDNTFDLSGNTEGISLKNEPIHKDYKNNSLVPPPFQLEMQRRNNPNSKMSTVDMFYAFEYYGEQREKQLTNGDKIVWMNITQIKKIVENDRKSDKKTIHHDLLIINQKLLEILKKRINLRFVYVPSKKLEEAKNYIKKTPCYYDYCLFIDNAVIRREVPKLKAIPKCCIPKDVDWEKIIDEMARKTTDINIYIHYTDATCTRLNRILKDPELEFAGKLFVHVISDNLYNQLNCATKDVKTGDYSKISESIKEWRKHTADIYYMEVVDMFVENTMLIQRTMKDMQIGKLELICAKEKEQYDNIFEICNNISEDSNQFTLLSEIVFLIKEDTKNCIIV